MCFSNRTRHDFRKCRPIFIYPPDKTSEETAALDLLRGVNKLREEGTFCDVTLKVGELKIRAHKLVICAGSAYFMAMFSGNFSESDQQEIRMEEIDALSLDMLIIYMYTGTLFIDSNNVKNLLLTASFLQMTRAVELCCKYLKGELNKENCMEYLVFAATNSINGLIDSTIEVVSNHFPYIFSKREYFDLEYEEFKCITQLFKTAGHPEDLIYSFVTQWIQYSYESRINAIEDLLKLLDPSLISPNVLRSFENTSNPAFTAWAAENNAARDNAPKDHDDHILVSRRLPGFGALRIKIFSDEKHRQIEMLPDEITDGSYVCNGYYVYHLGGFKYGDPLDETYAYHPVEREWSRFVPLQEGRAYHRSCVLNGKIYSFGGSDGFKALPSFEFIDLYTGQSGFVDNLPRAKERMGLGLHGNTIYVVGGCDRGKGYKCIHRYDAREGVWQELAPSPYRAGAGSCAVLGDNIYTTHPDTLQRFDIRTNEWTMISAQYKRYPPEVFALNNTLFGLFNDHIARFIPEGGRWENQRTLHLSLPYLQVSTNLLLPNVNKYTILDPVFEGDYARSEEDNAAEDNADDWVNPINMM